MYYTISRVTAFKHTREWARVNSRTSVICTFEADSNIIDWDFKLIENLNVANWNIL